ncbi:MAG: Dabb family protein [Deltaproteobacteria bacterium]|nr:MAG: Dabb family protein [Deltaproteobacteria bacterium]
MIRHLIFLKFKPETTENDIKAIETGLAALPAAIPEIESFEFGRDLVHSERSFDFALVSRFKDLDALKRYQLHPAHQEILVQVRAACTQILAVDYQV